MNFVELKAELAARGYSRLSDARLGLCVNEGRRRLDNAALWPYRLASASGAAPLTIADLGSVEEVLDTSNSSQPLTHSPRRSILDDFGDLTTTGHPWYFYIDNGVVRTYPVGGTLAVRYYKRTAVLTSTATPLAPEDYHMLYVDLAEEEAHAGKTDWAGAQALEARIQLKMQEMLNDLFGQQVQGADGFMALADGSVDS